MSATELESSALGLLRRIYWTTSVKVFFVELKRIELQLQGHFLKRLCSSLINRWNCDFTPENLSDLEVFYNTKSYGKIESSSHT